MKCRFLKYANKTIEVHPFQIVDTGDDDINIDLCSNEKRVPISATV